MLKLPLVNFTQDHELFLMLVESTSSATPYATLLDIDAEATEDVEISFFAAKWINPLTMQPSPLPVPLSPDNILDTRRRRRIVSKNL